MARTKQRPARKTAKEPDFESDGENETVLADEEMERLEHELELIRRQKLLHIQKMRLLQQTRHNNQDVTTDGRSSASTTKSLAIGIDKAQQRFMFNLNTMEEKYAEKERRRAPETMIEMDHNGQFFYPENMAGSHQQQFINRLFQRDSQMGKGLVSAPRNSIDSFDGDERALKKCRLLDERFHREMRRHQTRSSEEEDMELTLRTESESTNKRFRSAAIYEELDDDVFGGNRRRSNLENDRRRHLTTSTITSFFNEYSSSEEENEFADDEEFSDETSSEESDMDEEMTPVASKVKKEEIPLETFKLEPVVVKSEPDSEMPGKSRRVETLKMADNSMTVKSPEKSIKTTESAESAVRTPGIVIKTVKSPRNIVKAAECAENAVETAKSPETVVKTAESSENAMKSTKSAENASSKCHGKKNEKTAKNGKEPYCKHCELIAEEKKKAKLERKSGVKPETPKEKVTVPLKKKSPQEGPSSSSCSSGKKRRSAAVTAEEPTLKKQKLSESDLLSIPSSMAVIVDTELIESENTGLVAGELSIFSERNPSESSVWTSCIDQNWMESVEEAARNSKDTKIFGISVRKVSTDTSTIANWANNLRPGNCDKDPFETDYRRQLAQSKKARSDGKAGYDVRM